MARPRKHLRRLGMMLFGTGVVLAILWYASLDFGRTIRIGDRWEVSCFGGVLSTLHAAPSERVAVPEATSGPSYREHDPGASWRWIGMERRANVGMFVSAPLWIPALVLLALGILLLWVTGAVREFAAAFRAAAGFRCSSRLGLAMVSLVGFLVFAMYPTTTRGVLLSPDCAVAWGNGVLSAVWEDGPVNGFTLRDKVETARQFGPFFTYPGAAGRLWAFGYSSQAQWWTTRIPLWVPAALFLPPGLWLCWRSRFRAGQCRRCRYNLAGLPPNSRCPECGHMATAT